MQADRGNRGYFPFGTGSAKNPFSQEDRKEAFNAYGAPPYLQEPTLVHGHVGSVRKVC